MSCWVESGECKEVRDFSEDGGDATGTRKAASGTMIT